MDGVSNPFGGFRQKFVLRKVNGTIYRDGKMNRVRFTVAHIKWSVCPKGGW